jgi:hypothetical protein
LKQLKQIHQSSGQSAASSISSPHFKQIILRTSCEKEKVAPLGGENHHGTSSAGPIRGKFPEPTHLFFLGGQKTSSEFREA